MLSVFVHGRGGSCCVWSDESGGEERREAWCVGNGGFEIGDLVRGGTGVIVWDTVGVVGRGIQWVRERAWMGFWESARVQRVPLNRQMWRLVLFEWGL